MKVKVLHVLHQTRPLCACMQMNKVPPEAVNDMKCAFRPKMFISNSHSNTVIEAVPLAVLLIHVRLYTFKFLQDLLDAMRGIRR